MAHKGVKILSRRSYEASVTTEYDYPLSAHFDENDALIYFDDVHVPWERVFIYRDTDLCRAQFSDTYAHYLPELPGPDPPHGEDAVPRRSSAQGWPRPTAP